MVLTFNRLCTACQRRSKHDNAYFAGQPRRPRLRRAARARHAVHGGHDEFQGQPGAASEVPPNTSAGKGAVTATYDNASKKLTWNGTYSGLTGPATAAHFHGPAPAGKNAGVMIPISADHQPARGLGHAQ